jgi:hypothetical protein
MVVQGMDLDATRSTAHLAMGPLYSNLESTLLINTLSRGVQSLLLYKITLHTYTTCQQNQPSITLAESLGSFGSSTM